MAAGVPVPISVSWDITVGYSLHIYIPPPPAPPVPVPWTPTVELPVPHFWPPGVGLGSVKKTATVLHHGSFAIILEGHDCGILVPQLTYPQPNVWNLVFPLSSSRKIVFQSFYNRMDKKQTGLTALWPPLPMLACGEPMSWPLTFPITNMFRDVMVGMTIADFVGGWMNIGFSMATSYISSRLWPPPAKAPIWYDALAGLLQSGLTSTVQHLIDPNYPVKIETKIKLGATSKWSVNAGVTFGSADTTNNPSSVTGGVSYELWKNSDTSLQGPTTKGSATATGSVTYTWDAGANNATSRGVVATGGVSAKTMAGGGSGTVTAAYNPDNRDAAGRDNSVAFSGSASGNTPLSTGTASGTVNPYAPEGERASGSVSVSNNNLPGNNGYSASSKPNATGPGRVVTTTRTGGGELTEAGDTRTTTVTTVPGRDGNAGTVTTTNVGPGGTSTSTSPLGRAL